MMDATKTVAYSGDLILHARAKHIGLGKLLLKMVESGYVPTEMMTVDPSLNLSEQIYYYCIESRDHTERDAKEWQIERAEIKRRTKR